MKDALIVENLTFSYDGLRVLNGVSFSVEDGNFISVLGPNGSGKSTLIKLISKVLKSYKGKIIVKGRDIKHLNEKDVARLVAVVPQYTTPGFDFSVDEFVMMGRYPYWKRFGIQSRKDLKIVEDVMERTRITSFCHRKFNELSGGEKQRVVIAQALAQDTPVLLLDEPTAHLDINFQIELMDLFYRLNTVEGKTIIGVFHDINLAVQYSKKILLLRDGKVFGFGDAKSVINRDNIRKVFNSEVCVGKNPFTGNLYVSPIFTTSLYNNSRDEEGKSKNKQGKKLKIHVIGGGGAASPILTLLYSSGYEKLSCGVVNILDSDLETSKVLGIPYVSEAPFSPISFSSQNQNLEFIKISDIVILPDIEFGHGNFSNLVAVKEALDLGKKVIILDARSVEERDYTQGKAVKLYSKIIEKGARVISSVKELLEALEE
ncbi:MAG: ABC transporter ATP-binding protein [Actinobacteria bacterium]|nr:ABC transporter ATP-binding protein [Actinomycetota bacterium]